MSAGWMRRLTLSGMFAVAMLGVVAEPAVGADGPAVRPAIGRVLSTDTSASSANKHIKSKTSKTKIKIAPLKLQPMMGDVRPHTGKMRDIGTDRRRDTKRD